jgi:acyl-CoA thioester hydrolase
MSLPDLRNRRRKDYKYHLSYRTRWSDNDMYDHMNNSVYYFLFDSIVNTYLIKHWYIPLYMARPVDPN